MKLKEILPNETVETTPCPNCGETELKLHQKLVADPIGTASLAGVQPKFTATMHLWIECDGCGAKGRVSRA